MCLLDSNTYSIAGDRKELLSHPNAQREHHQNACQENGGLTEVSAEKSVGATLRSTQGWWFLWEPCPVQTSLRSFFSEGQMVFVLSMIENSSVLKINTFTQHNWKTSFQVE
jgi:hypothetical protein